MPIFSKHNKRQSDKWLEKVLGFMSYTDAGLNNMSRVLLNAMERIKILEDRAGLTAEREVIKIAADKITEKKESKKEDKKESNKEPSKEAKKAITKSKTNKIK